MIQVGKQAPAFALASSDGDTVTLSDQAGKLVVLYFYPRDNTPGCTLEAQDFRDALPEFHRHGAVVFGVSKDSIESHCKFRDKYGLTFPLLSDPDGKVLEAYGAWGEKVLYGKRSMGIIRSTVLVDREGKIARHWPKVSVKGHAAEVLAAIAELANGAQPAVSRAATLRAPGAMAKPAKAGATGKASAARGNASAKARPAARAKLGAKARPAVRAKASVKARPTAARRARASHR